MQYALAIRPCYMYVRWRKCANERAICMSRWSWRLLAFSASTAAGGDDSLTTTVQGLTPVLDWVVAKLGQAVSYWHASHKATAKGTNGVKV